MEIACVFVSRIFRLNWSKFAVLAAVIVLAGHATAQVEYVDPTIGNVGILLQPTRPAVFLPNSMVRVYPIRADALDDQIKSFPLTISSHRMQELFSIMPGEDGSAAAYDQEKTTPYYYSTRFDDSLIQTEFTATERCGYFRFTFPRRQGFRRAGQPHVRRSANAKWNRGQRRRALQQHEGICLR